MRPRHAPDRISPCIGACVQCTCSMPRPSPCMQQGNIAQLAGAARGSLAPKVSVAPPPVHQYTGTEAHAWRRIHAPPYLHEPCAIAIRALRPCHGAWIAIPRPRRAFSEVARVYVLTCQTPVPQLRIPGFSAHATLTGELCWALPGRDRATGRAVPFCSRLFGRLRRVNNRTTLEFTASTCTRVPPWLRPVWR